MNPSTPYLFYEIWVPKRAPYQGAHIETDRSLETDPWPAIVGDFVKPLADAFPESLCWWVQEGPFFQVCFATDQPKVVRRAMTLHARKTRFRIKRLLVGTLGGALAGDRWNKPSRMGKKAEAARSVLLVETMDRVCRFYADLLERRRGRWVVEPVPSRQNPHLNPFESLMHLLANTSGAAFDVQLQVRTRWMHNGWQKVSAKCHL